MLVSEKVHVMLMASQKATVLVYWLGARLLAHSLVSLNVLVLVYWLGKECWMEKTLEHKTHVKTKEC
jgi:hypothetical protein